MKHTPGPWLIHPHVDLEYSIFNKNGTAHIGDITTEADAKLISAAHDLLDAAVEYFYLKTYHPSVKDTGIKTEEEVFAMIKNAIDKATK